MSWRYFIVVPYFYGGNLLQTDIHCTILHNNIYIHDCDMPISYFTAKPPTEMSNIKRNSAFTAACTMYSQSTFSQLSNKNQSRKNEDENFIQVCQSPFESSFQAAISSNVLLARQSVERSCAQSSTACYLKFPTFSILFRQMKCSTGANDIFRAQHTRTNTNSIEKAHTDSRNERRKN